MSACDGQFPVCADQIAAGGDLPYQLSGIYALPPPLLQWQQATTGTPSLHHYLCPALKYLPLLWNWPMMGFHPALPCQPQPTQPTQAFPVTPLIRSQQIHKYSQGVISRNVNRDYPPTLPSSGPHPHMLRHPGKQPR